MIMERKEIIAIGLMFTNRMITKVKKVKVQKAQVPVLKVLKDIGKMTDIGKLDIIQDMDITLDMEVIILDMDMTGIMITLGGM